MNHILTEDILYFILIEEQKRQQEMMSEVSSTKYTTSSRKEQYVEPKFTMIQEPNNTAPQYLVFEIALPKQVFFHGSKNLEYLFFNNV